MRVNASAGFIFEGEMHLIRSASGNHVAWKQGAIIRDHSFLVISIFNMDSDAVEDVSILAINVALGPLLNDGFNRNDDSLTPFFGRHSNFESLPRLKLPIDKPFAGLVALIEDNLVGQRQVEAKRSCRGVNGVSQVQQFQMISLNGVVSAGHELR